jgi:hypothetical protein
VLVNSVRSVTDRSGTDLLLRHAGCNKTLANENMGDRKISREMNFLNLIPTKVCSAVSKLTYRLYIVGDGSES